MALPEGAASGRRRRPVRRYSPKVGEPPPGVPDPSAQFGPRKPVRRYSVQSGRSFGPAPDVVAASVRTPPVARLIYESSWLESAVRWAPLPTPHGPHQAAPVVLLSRRSKRPIGDERLRSLSVNFSYVRSSYPPRFQLQAFVGAVAQHRRPVRVYEPLQTDVLGHVPVGAPPVIPDKIPPPKRLTSETSVVDRLRSPLPHPSVGRPRREAPVDTFVRSRAVHPDFSFIWRGIEIRQPTRNKVFREQPPPPAVRCLFVGSRVVTEGSWLLKILKEDRGARIAPFPIEHTDFKTEVVSSRVIIEGSHAESSLRAIFQPRRQFPHRVAPAINTHTFVSGVIDAWTIPAGGDTWTIEANG